MLYHLNIHGLIQHIVLTLYQEESLAYIGTRFMTTNNDLISPQNTAHISVISTAPESSTSLDRQAHSERPEDFHMKIHSGMLETMGHNMYSSVAKCIAEFVANAYDADAKNVYIEMDFDKIDSAKRIIRSKAKEDKKAGIRSDISAIYDPLPSDITIKIRDDGHGMSAKQIQDFFLSVTRNRREDDDGKPTKIFTESGLRRVMGRKGVGKLAGFGAAEHIKVTSKRAGEYYSTTFEMDYINIKQHDDLGNARFKASYENDLSSDDQFTEITLSQLRCDSMKASQDRINNILARTFCILDKDFHIYLNNTVVKEEEIDWEFSYPAGNSMDKMASEIVQIDEDDTFSFQYLIRFRARPDDYGATDEKKKKRASLPAERRGARIYSHGRLTHGPSLLKLHSGVHNFHGQDYMECIVIADAIDEFENDFIVTSREGLNKDNPVVDHLFDSVTALMKTALAEHYKFRDKEIDNNLDNDDFSKGILSPLQQVNKKSQKAARQILKVIGREHGINSSTYREMAPIMLQAVNASEVLTRLIELETDPKSIPVLAHSLVELTRMETSDLLKLYRGRSKAIGALYKLHTESISTRKGKGYEKELHGLFKDSPWLIQPEFASYLTSDKPMGELCKTLNSILNIDDALTEEDSIEDDMTRPDLVFVAANQPNPDDIIIVELKSPGIELEVNHLIQLEEYMFKTSEYLTTKLGKSVRVRGYLIGTKPNADTKATGKRHLLQKITEIGPNTKYSIFDILDLLTRAQQVHKNGIEIFEAEEKRLNEELN